MISRGADPSTIQSPKPSKSLDATNIPKVVAPACRPTPRHMMSDPTRIPERRPNASMIYGTKKSPMSDPRLIDALNKPRILPLGWPK